MSIATPIKSTDDSRAYDWSAGNTDTGCRPSYKRHEANRKLIARIWHEIDKPDGPKVAQEYERRTGKRTTAGTCRKYCPRSLRPHRRRPARRDIAAVPSDSPQTPIRLSSLRKELEAMEAIVTALDGLEQPSRDRVMTWIFDRVV
jgi:hypothetical protein